MIGPLQLDQWPWCWELFHRQCKRPISSSASLFISMLTHTSAWQAYMPFTTFHDRPQTSVYLDISEQAIATPVASSRAAVQLDRCAHQRVSIRSEPWPRPSSILCNSAIVFIPPQSSSATDMNKGVEVLMIMASKPSCWAAPVSQHIRL